MTRMVKTSHSDVEVATLSKVSRVFLFICLSGGLNVILFAGDSPSLPNEESSGVLVWGPTVSVLMVPQAN